MKNFERYLLSQHLGRTHICVSRDWSQRGLVIVTSAALDMGSLRFFFDVSQVQDRYAPPMVWQETVARLAVSLAQRLFKQPPSARHRQTLPLRLSARPWVGDLFPAPDDGSSDGANATDQGAACKPSIYNGANNTLRNKQ